VGIGTPTPGSKLDVNGTSNFTGNMAVAGNVTINGNCTRTGTDNFTSDQQFKTNIDTIADALAIIKRLSPKTFYFDTTNVYGLKFPTEKQYGLIAQDVQQIFPEAVKVDTLGYLNLNIHPILIAFVNAFKEQQATIDSLKQNQKTTDSLLTQQKTIDSIQTIALNNMVLHQQTTDALLNQQRTADSLLTETVNNLMATVTNCCSQNSSPKMMLNNDGQTQGETLQVELANNSQTILFQNQPNPFNESTLIRYFIPKNATGSAFVIFFDVYGQEIKRTEITTKGFGNINVNAENLLSGVYSYSLHIDGKVIDTKKMVKNK
jgi:hypothetical protein